MTATQIVSRLEAMGVAIWAENGAVCFKDPHRVMTPPVLQTLQKGKAEVLKVIAQRPKPWSGPAAGRVSDPLETLGELCEMESRLFAAMRYEAGSGKVGPWVGEQEILHAVGANTSGLKAQVFELLGALEAAGRVVAHRRYQSNPLWRVVPPQGLYEHITPPNGYKPVSGPSFTDWEEMN